MSTRTAKIKKVNRQAYALLDAIVEAMPPASKALWELEGKLHGDGSEEGLKKWAEVHELASKDPWILARRHAANTYIMLPVS